MNDNTTVIRHCEAGVLTLTLNRPESLNALNASLLGELRDALDSATDDNSIGAIIVCGAGRAFSSGGDLREGATRQPPPVPGGSL